MYELPSFSAEDIVKDYDLGSVRASVISAEVLARRAFNLYKEDALNTVVLTHMEYYRSVKYYRIVRDTVLSGELKKEIADLILLKQIDDML